MVDKGTLVTLGLLGAVILGSAVLGGVGFGGSGKTSSGGGSTRPGRGTTPRPDDPMPDPRDEAPIVTTPVIRPQPTRREEFFPAPIFSPQRPPQRGEETFRVPTEIFTGFRSATDIIGTLSSNQRIRIRLKQESSGAVIDAFNKGFLTEEQFEEEIRGIAGPL